MAVYRIKTVGFTDNVPSYFMVRKRTLLNDTVVFRGKSLAECVKWLRKEYEAEIQRVVDEWAESA